MPITGRTKSILMPLVLLAATAAPRAETGPVPGAEALAYDLYKSPTCGCCELWQDHLDASAFAATVHHPQDLDGVKRQLGIRPQYQSCHTAVVADDYVFEGHVPARYIQQFLADPPPGAIGLAVPGMPVGSPGMEMGDRFMAYNVLLLKADGSSEVYAAVASADQQ